MAVGLVLAADLAVMDPKTFSARPHCCWTLRLDDGGPDVDEALREAGTRNEWNDPEQSCSFRADGNWLEPRSHEGPHRMDDAVGIRAGRSDVRKDLHYWCWSTTC